MCAPIRFIIISFTIFHCPSLPAGEERFSFSPGAAVAHALAHNPELNAARRQIAIAEAELHWAERLDNPALEVTGSSDRFGLDDDESVWEIALAQKFPLTKRLERERDLSQADLALAEAEVRVREWKLAGEVREKAIDALALQQRINFREQRQEVLEELAQSLQDAYEKAEASSLDVTEAKLEARAHLKEMRHLEAEAAAASGELRPLLGLPANARLRITGKLENPSRPGPIAPSDDHLARRPDLQLQLLQENRAETAIALAGSHRWEDVAIRLFMEREAMVDAPDGLERNTFVGLGFSLPLPLRTPAARLTDVPREELAASRARTEALTAAIRHEITLAGESLADHYAIWTEASGETLSLARRHIQGVRESWDLGKESFIRLQRAQERALTLEEAAIESLREYHLAKVHVEQAQGK